MSLYWRFPLLFFFLNRGILKTQSNTSLSALMVDVRTFAGAPGGAVFPIVSCKVTALALQPGSGGGVGGGGSVTPSNRRAPPGPRSAPPALVCSRLRAGGAPASAGAVLAPRRTSEPRRAGQQRPPVFAPLILTLTAFTGKAWRSACLRPRPGLPRHPPAPGVPRAPPLPASPARPRSRRPPGSPRSRRPPRAEPRPGGDR